MPVVTKLPLFSYPRTWGGNLCIAESLNPSQDLCPKCGRDSYVVHRMCNACLEWYVTCGRCEHCLVSFPVGGGGGGGVLPPVVHSRWSVELTVPPVLTAVRDFINLGVTDVQTELTFLDCARKLDGLDPREGVGLLHVVAECPAAFQVVSPERGPQQQRAAPSPREAENGHALAQLLELGLNPDVAAKLRPGFSAWSPAKQGGAPLHFAVHEARVESVRLLVDAGADIFALDARGMTPYVLAKHLLDAHAKRSGLDPPRVPRWKMILHILEVAIREKPTLASLIRDQKWYAVRSWMRRGKVRLSMFCQMLDGRTAMDLLWDNVMEAARSAGSARDAHRLSAASKILAEVKFRFGSTVLPMTSSGINYPTFQHRSALMYPCSNDGPEMGGKTTPQKFESSAELSDVLYSVPIRLPKDTKTSTPITTDI